MLSITDGSAPFRHSYKTQKKTPIFMYATFFIVSMSSSRKSEQKKYDGRAPTRQLLSSNYPKTPRKTTYRNSTHKICNYYMQCL
jgi:hypothetical protein